jgi:hypothetical protein
MRSNRSVAATSHYSGLRDNCDYLRHDLFDPSRFTQMVWQLPDEEDVGDRVFWRLAAILHQTRMALVARVEFNANGMTLHTPLSEHNIGETRVDVRAAVVLVKKNWQVTGRSKKALHGFKNA